MPTIEKQIEQIEQRIYQRKAKWYNRAEDLQAITETIHRMTSITLTVDLTEALDLEMILQAVAVSPSIDKASASLINRLRRQLDEAVAAVPDEEFEAALK